MRNDVCLLYKVISYQAFKALDIIYVKPCVVRFSIAGCGKSDDSVADLEYGHYILQLPIGIAYAITDGLGSSVLSLIEVRGSGLGSGGVDSCLDEAHESIYMETCADTCGIFATYGSYSAVALDLDVVAVVVNLRAISVVTATDTGAELTAQTLNRAVFNHNIACRMSSITGNTG